MDASHDDIAACAGLVQRGDPDRFMAAMAAKPDARDLLFPLYAFNLEVARAPWLTQETMIAEMRLQWWRDALEEIGQGGNVRRHEVVTPLAAFLDHEGAETLDALVAARQWDIYKDPFEDAAKFAAYIDATSGNLMWVAARLLGDAQEDVVRDFAYATGIANWLRAIPDLQERKRIPLVDGRPEAVALLASGALQRLKSARKTRAAVSKPSGQALLAGWQAEAVLRQASEQPERVVDGALGQSDFVKKITLMRLSMTGRW
ncbi:Squalene/phytoene synthase [Shimia gijangensis]|uniref:Squalene/phytoene synthase n=1 Tax=Shimia gijangensis TaxID=1470563 RepID=A0A1M6HLD2_9RHOB|nr:squalene/phytoene synthase family protein [Shimia gijangensis]SHJ22969.1 Squalene/phytoene synthase [Shimia gijangensis]